MQKIKRTRKELFEEEKRYLKPLPESFKFSNYKRAKVGIDYHVDVEGTYYSVPYQNIHRNVDISYDAELVKVYRNLKIIATHKRDFRKNFFVTFCIEELDFKSGRGLSKSQIIELSSNDWIKKKRNIIITGATGAGKTYLSCSFGNSALRDGIDSLYVKLPRLLNEVKLAKLDGSYIRILNKISKIKLLIIDDWGIDFLDETQRRDLLEIFEDRHELTSTIILNILILTKREHFLNKIFTKNDAKIRMNGGGD